MTYDIFPRHVSIKHDSEVSYNWNTEVKRSASGKVRTLTTYPRPRITFKVKAVGLSDSDARDLVGFFANQKGGARPFLWLDHELHAENDILLGKGDGVRRDFKAVKRIGALTLNAAHVDPASLVVKVDGERVGAKVSDGGVIVLDKAPEVGARVVASYVYYWLVFLEKDEVAIRIKAPNVNETSTLQLGVIE